MPTDERGEPFNGLVLMKYFQRHHGAEFLRQSASSHSRWRLRPDCPCGKHGPDNITLVPPSDPVFKRHMIDLSRKIGMSYPEFRAALGYPIPVHKGKVYKPVARQQIGRGAVLTAAHNLRSALADIESEIKQGDRDPSVYEKAWETIVEAQLALEKWRDHFATMHEMAEATQRREVS